MYIFKYEAKRRLFAHVDESGLVSFEDLETLKKVRPVVFFGLLVPCSLWERLNCFGLLSLSSYARCSMILPAIEHTLEGVHLASLQT